MPSYSVPVLCAYSTTLGISNSQLLQQRYQQNYHLNRCQLPDKLTLTAITLLSSISTRWLLTTAAGESAGRMPEFEQILVCETPDSIGIDWTDALQQLATLFGTLGSTRWRSISRLNACS